MLILRDPPAKDETSGMAKRQYSMARMTVRQKGAAARPRAAMTPHTWMVAATGKQPPSSSFSNARTTTGYCSCTHLNCRVAHTPAQVLQWTCSSCFNR